MSGEREDADGLHGKYRVEKDGEPVEDCFVLEPESDAAALAALKTYARETENSALAEDLQIWIVEIENGPHSPASEDENLETDENEPEGECDVCGAVETLTTTRVEDDETGEKRDAKLCSECRHMAIRQPLPEDVDWPGATKSDESEGGDDCGE